MDDDRRVLAAMSMYASAIAELRRMNDPRLDPVVERLLKEQERLGRPLQGQGARRPMQHSHR